MLSHPSFNMPLFLPLQIEYLLRASHLSYDGDRVLTDRLSPCPGPACSYKQSEGVGGKAGRTVGGCRLVLKGGQGHNGDCI